MKAKFLIVFLILSLSVVQAASAQDDIHGKDWSVGLGLYGWYADMNAKTTEGNEAEIDAQDLLDNLQMGFMGLLEVHKNKWGFLVDAIYIEVEDDTDITSHLRAELELSNWIVTPMITYRLVKNDHFILNCLAGARYLYLKTDLTIESHGAVSPVRRNISESGDIWDGIIGLRGKVRLSENWSLPYHLDVGLGESEVTWQALTGIGYRFDIVEIIAGYRYLDWQFDNRPIFDNLTAHGPFAGIKFWF